MASPPTPTTGALTVNSTTGVILSPITAALFKSANGLGDAADIVITDDVATNATMYPVWVTANAGALPLYVASTKLSFNPSTGRLTSTAGTIGSIGLAASSLTGVATLTSPAATDLSVGTGTAGTALTIASATRIATFAAGVTGTSLTLSSLTSGRVTFASTAGLLSDANSLTFNSGTGLLTATGFAASALTSTALLLGGGSAAINPADLTYVSPTLTVPDAFSLTSAGSIRLTAGGSNKGFLATTTGTGGLVLNNGGVASGPAAAFQGFQNLGPLGTEAGYLAQGAGTGTTLRFVGIRSNGTYASPTALIAGDTILSVSGRGHDGTSFSGSAVGITMSGQQAWATTPTATRSTKMTFFTIPFNSTSTQNTLVLGESGQLLRLGAVSATIDSGSAFSTTGVLFGTALSNTFRDTVSSGTVASAVASSFAVPTFSASSTTTFTNAANLYIAGDVANGTNVTLTNTYGLWNAGKTRFDGLLRLFNDVTIEPQADGKLNFDRTGTATYGRIVFRTAGTEMWALGQRGDSGTNNEFSLTRTSSGTAVFNVTQATGAFNLTSGLLTIGATTSSITGAAGNMTITAGTGASRTLTLQTTTSGGAAAAVLTLDAGQSATFANNITLQGTALITKPGGTIPIFTTNTAITTGAGVQAGTLLNSPVAGNPTKWIPVNDNGNTLYIPAW